MDEGSGKVVIELDLSTGQFTTSINGVQQHLENLKAGGKKAGESMTSSFVAAELYVKALEKAVEFAGEALNKLAEGVKAAAEKEILVTRMNQSLATAGQYTKEVSASMQEFADKMEKTSLYGSDVIIKAEAMATTFTKTAEQTHKLTQAAVELSARTGMDLPAAVQRIGLSLEGYSTGLQKLVPATQKLTTEQLKAGAAIDLILKQMGGSSAVIMNTFQGRVTVMAHSWESVLESFGKMITNSPIINRAIEMISKTLQGIAHSVESFANSGGFEKLLKQTISWGVAITSYIGKPIEVVWNTAKFLFNAFEVGIALIIGSMAKVEASLMDYFQKPILTVIEYVSKLVGVFDSAWGEKLNEFAQKTYVKIAESYHVVADASFTFMNEKIVDTKSAFENIFDTSIAEKIQSRLAEFDVGMNKLRAKEKSFINAEKEEIGFFKENYRKGLKELEQQHGSLANSIKVGTMQTHNIMTKSFIEAAKGHGNAMEMMKQQFLEMIGTKMIETGVFMMLDAFSTFPMIKVPELAQGAAAVAAGSALVGASGGGSSVSTPTTSSADGGFMTPAPTLGPATNEQMAPQKSGQIIINGPYLNTKDTANHLIDLFREHSDISDWAVVAQGRTYGSA